MVRCSHQPPSELGNNSKVSVRLSISLEGELCCCLATKSCLTLCDPMDCSPLGSTVHGISQARIQEWVAISFSTGSSLPSTSELQVDSLCLSHCGSPWGGTRTLFFIEWRGTKKPLDESESGERKSWLKAQHSENEGHGIWSHHFMGNRWGNSGNSDRLYFSGLQNHYRWWLQPWN